MINKIKQHKISILKYSIVIIIAFLIGYVPTGYYCMMPGNIMSLNEIVEVDAIKSDNSFGLTTVSVARASLPVLLFGKLAPNVRIEPEGRVVPEGWSKEEYSVYSKYLMTNSHNNAKLAAADLLGLEYEIFNDTPYILRVLEDGPSIGKLKSGDIIKSINGIEMNNLNHARDTFKTYQPDEVLSVGIMRKNNLITEQISVGRNDEGEGFIGISLISKDKYVEISGHEVNIKTGNITGPSAGAMISMEILNKLGAITLPENIKFAGTGTIERDGAIGSIGGINQKIVTAFRSGINFYFMPESNLDDIIIDLTLYQDMTIVPVRNLDDIKNYINGLTKKPELSQVFLYNNKRMSVVLPLSS